MALPIVLWLYSVNVLRQTDKNKKIRRMIRRLITKFELTGYVDIS